MGIPPSSAITAQLVDGALLIAALVQAQNPGVDLTDPKRRDGWQSAVTELFYEAHRLDKTYLRSLVGDFRRYLPEVPGDTVLALIAEAHTAMCKLHGEPTKI